MGVTISQLIVPRARAYRPEGARIQALIEALGEHEWTIYPLTSEYKGVALNVVDGQFESGIYYQTGDGEKGEAPYPVDASWLEERMRGELALDWSLNYFSECGLKNILSRRFVGFDETSYGLSLYVAPDYIYFENEVIDPYPTTKCLCGRDLLFELVCGNIFATGSRIHYRCPACQTVFDPSEITVIGRDAMTNETRPTPGGGAFRFGIVLDSIEGQMADPDKNTISVRQDFIELLESVFARPFMEISSVR